MDDTLCHSFFRQPTQPLHRRYEALRAFFVDHQPLPEVARQYGYQYGSLRNLVADFRAQCRSGRLPPFLSTRSLGGAPLAWTAGAGNQIRRPLLTATNSPSRRVGLCVLVSLASSFSCPSWPVCALTPWSAKLAIPAHAG